MVRIRPKAITGKIYTNKKLVNVFFLLVNEIQGVANVLGNLFINTFSQNETKEMQPGKIILNDV